MPGSASTVAPMWLLRASKVLAWVFGMAVGAGAMAGAEFASFAWFGARSLFLSVPLAVLVWLALVTVHELGHLLAARWAGGTVMWAHVACVQVKTLRSGWRVRLKRWPSGQFAAVFTVPGASGDLRRQMLLLFGGGPLINGVFGLVLMAVAVAMAGARPWYVSPLTWWGAASIFLGLANLMPVARGVGSDGFNLLKWLRSSRDQLEAESCLLRLNALSLQGTLAAQLPGHLLDALDSCPQPLPMCRHWFRLKAFQVEREWVLAVREGEAFEAKHAEQDKALSASLDDITRWMRIETAFCQVMAGDAAASELEGRLSEWLERDWLAPHLASRCRALVASLGGDIARMKVELDRSETFAESSIDAAQRESERRLRQAIASRSPLASALA